MKLDNPEKVILPKFQNFFEEIMSRYKDIYITELDSMNRDQEITLNQKSMTESSKRKKMKKEESFCC